MRLLLLIGLIGGYAVLYCKGRKQQKKVPIEDTGFLTPMIRYRGKLLPYAEMPELIIYSRAIKKWKDWNQTRRAVYTCYPYLRTLLLSMREVEEAASSMPAREKNKFIRKKEKELREQFAARVRNMTLYEGKILLKLLHRETSKTGYAIIRELRGKFRAAFYEGVAHLFGGSLKYNYDPKHNTEDKYIEEIFLEARQVYGF